MIADAQDSLYTPGTGQYSTPDSTTNDAIGGGQTPYVMPRQTGTGITRGTQGLGIGGVKTTPNGLEITDENNVTFVSITKAGIVLYDGTNNRILIGTGNFGTS